MYRFLIVAVIATIINSAMVRAEDCPETRYEGLIIEARSADGSRQWDRAVDLYRIMLADCSALLTGGDLVKAYDALAVGLLMQGNPGAAIETATKCLELDGRYNACMMTAAQASYELGDKERAVGFAREAVEIGSYDDYSNAVVIAARDFLKKVGTK